MAGLQEYKCPCCGGAIEFNSTLQKMKCPYCDTEFAMETLQNFNQELGNEQEDNLQWDANAGQEWGAGETQGLKTYLCRSCGAEIIGDDTLASTKCPYCDNNIIMQGQFKDDLKPDYVIPFKLDKEAAKKTLLKHYEGKKLLPAVFRDQNHLDEIKGVYVPVWLFDADADVDLRYRATKVRVWADANWNYTETAHYSVSRSGKIAYDLVPVDGSSKMDATMLQSLEPYNFDDAVDFNTAYLAGYLSDKYDITAEDSIEQANNRIRTSTERAFSSTISGYASLTPEHSSIRLNNGKAKYALYPVWLLNTTWNGRKYQFAMNGQTGKFVGDLPADNSAVSKYMASTGGIVAVAVFAISFLLWLL